MGIAMLMVNMIDSLSGGAGKGAENMIDKIIAAIEECKKKVRKNVELNSHGDVYRDMERAVIPYNRCIEIVRTVGGSGGWIPVSDRLPMAVESTGFDGERNYYRRMEVAVKTDTMDYRIAYYDGEKWFSKRHRIINNVVAWKIHEPYKLEEVRNGRK